MDIVDVMDSLDASVGAKILLILSKLDFVLDGKVMMVSYQR